MSFYPLAWPPATSPIDDGVIYLGDPTGISAYADQQTDAANTFLLQLGTLAANLTAPLIEPVFPAGPDAPALESPTAPTLQTVVWTAPDAPPVFTETLDVSDVMPEPFDDSPPTLVFGTAPTFDEAAPDAPASTLATPCQRLAYRCRQRLTYCRSRSHHLMVSTFLRLISQCRTSRSRRHRSVSMYQGPSILHRS
jgi:hypothetical protein